jgi:phytanoyl-CoA hydroxylase
MAIFDVDRYRRDGFLVLEGFVAERECDALRARATELVRAFEASEERDRRSVFTTDEEKRTSDDYFLDSGDDVRFFFEEDGRTINKIGHALHDLDPAFDRFSRTPELAGLVRALGVVAPLLVQSMYIFKQPLVGGEVRCHQDSTFLHAEPDTLVGLWFALEDAHQENGCLWALPGGHRAALKRRFVRESDRTTRFEELDASPWDESTLVPLEAPKGAVIVLDGRVPHRSHANGSPRSRHAYTLHVVSQESAYLQTNWLRRRSGMPARGF